MSSENITLHLSKIKNIQAYDKAFKTFWAFVLEKGQNPTEISLEEMALQLVNLNDINSNIARNAYAAIVQVPGFDSLKFNPC